LLFYRELEAMKDLAEADNVKIIQSVTRDPDWPGLHGRPQKFIVEANTNPKKTAVAICGPPRMYKSVFEALINYGYRPENIYVTLERKMKCGREVRPLQRWNEHELEVRLQGRPGIRLLRHHINTRVT